MESAGSLHRISSSRNSNIWSFAFLQRSLGWSSCRIPNHHSKSNKSILQASAPAFTRYQSNKTFSSREKTNPSYESNTSFIHHLIQFTSHQLAPNASRATISHSFAIQNDEVLPNQPQSLLPTRIAYPLSRFLLYKTTMFILCFVDHHNFITLLLLLSGLTPVASYCLCSVFITIDFFTSWAIVILSHWRLFHITCNYYSSLLFLLEHTLFFNFTLITFKLW